MWGATVSNLGKMAFRLWCPLWSPKRHSNSSTSFGIVLVQNQDIVLVQKQEIVLDQKHGIALVQTQDIALVAKHKTL